MKTITFEVVTYKNKIFFKLVGKTRVLLVNKVLSVFFEGYHHCTECKIIKNKKIVDKAYVQYYGTHAAMEFFFGFETITNQKMCTEVKAEMLQIGDILEIENLEEKGLNFYKDEDAFIVHVLGFHSLSESIEKAFEKNNNKLEKEEFFLAVCSGKLDEIKKLKKNKIFIINLEE
ncbi:MAG: hypothetical protein WA101_01885 [Minisyncoccia bacterium]